MRFVSTVQKFLFTAIFLSSSASFAAQGEVNISSEAQVDKTTEEVLEVFSGMHPEPRPPIRPPSPRPRNGQPQLF